jgi:hypothetical protein
MARNGTTWVKGMKSPNPNGRPPPGQSPTALLRAVLEEEHAPGVTKLAFLVRRAVDALVKDADAGVLRPADLAWLTSRLDGSPPLGLPVEEARERQARLDGLRERAASRAESAQSFGRLRALGQV